MDVAIIVLLVTTAIVTIAALVTRGPRVGRACLILGGLAAGSGLLAAFASIVVTHAATATTGLSESDRQRIWSAGLSEAAYDLLIAAVVAIPALLVSRRVARDADAA